MQEIGSRSKGCCRSELSIGHLARSENAMFIFTEIYSDKAGLWGSYKSMLRWSDLCERDYSKIAGFMWAIFIVRAL